MAGAGYKLFNTGDVLTAAQVNTYLQEQVVMVFNDATARTTALSGVLAEGMVSYLKSTKVVEIYNGTAWASLDDPNAIQNTIVDAKGDLIAATGNDVPARLAVGNNGESLVADSSATTGLRWQGNFAAGKNAIINGDFRIWQRGTSTNITNAVWTFSADRYQIYNTFSSGTCTSSQQTFTAGSAPTSGYEGQFFLRLTAATTGSSNVNIKQLVEDVRTFAGRTVTFSFWAKASADRAVDVFIRQNFGSGGSASVDSSPATVTVTTAWQRFTYTVTLGSMSGKTIGTGSSIEVWAATSTNFTGGTTLDFWGWQLESGNTATAFQTATGTLAGELAVCLRYYELSYKTGDAPGTNVTGGTTEIHANGCAIVQVPVTGTAGSSRGRAVPVPFKVVKRTTPTTRFWDLAGNISKYTAADVNGSFISNNNSVDTFGGINANSHMLAFQTSAASSAHIYCGIMWEASAEL